MFFSTIAAISTPVGKGGVAVIRISGSEAIEIAKRVFFPKNGKNITDYSPLFRNNPKKWRRPFCARLCDKLW